MKEKGLKSPIFITGTQRSGTTLLCRILSVHPDIFIRNEVPSVGNIVTSSITSSDFIENFNVEMKASFDKAINDYLISKNKSNWGLKDPDLTHHLDRLIKLFPNSKIVFIVRDGRAVANSYIKNMWGLGVNTYTGAKRWQSEITTQVEFFNKYRSQCYLLRFEDLVSDHEEECKKICEFLEISYSDEINNYYNHPTEITNRSQSKNVFKKPDSALSEKWKQDLTPFQISVFESVAGETMKKLGYDLLGSPVKINSLQKLWFNVHQRIVGEVQIQYQWRFKKCLKLLFNGHSS